MTTSAAVVTPGLFPFSICIRVKVCATGCLPGECYCSPSLAFSGGKDILRTHFPPQFTENLSTWKSWREVQGCKLRTKVCTGCKQPVAPEMFPRLKKRNTLVVTPKVHTETPLATCQPRTCQRAQRGFNLLGRGAWVGQSWPHWLARRRPRWNCSRRKFPPLSLNSLTSQTHAQQRTRVK